MFFLLLLLVVAGRAVGHIDEHDVSTTTSNTNALTAHHLRDHRETHFGVVETNENDVLVGTIQKDIPGLNPNVGNGYLGYQVFGDDVFVAGFYCRHSIAFVLPEVSRCVVSIPEAMTLSPKDDMSSKVELNVRKANVVETFASGVKRRFYAHRTRKNLLVLELEFDNTKSDQDKTFALSTRSVKQSKDLKLETSTQRNATTQLGHNVNPENKTISQTIAIVTSISPDSVVVRAKEMKTVQLFSAFYVEEDPNVSPENTLAAAMKIFENAVHSASRSEHESAWSDLWSRGGIELESSPKLATQLNSSFYYMLSSVREDVVQGVGPGGIQTDGYKGNYYWDNDVWAMPSVLPFWPELARTGLLYRFKHRIEAQEHAKEHGKDGYWFPFQTAGTGHETDLFEPANKLEIHVGGGIALLGQLYINATGNITFEKDVVEPLVQGTLSMLELEARGHLSLFSLFLFLSLSLSFTIHSHHIKKIRNCGFLRLYG